MAENSVFGQTHDPTSRTPTIGLAYTGDAVIDANLNRIDTAMAEIAVHIVALQPEPPPPEDATRTTESDTEEPHGRKKSRY